MVKSYLSDWWQCSTRGAPVWMEIPSVLLGWGFDLIPNMPQFVPYSFYAIFFSILIFYVPYRLYATAKEELNTEKQRSAPKIVIEDIADHMSVDLSDNALPTHIFQIRVRNVGAQHLDNCLVTLNTLYHHDQNMAGGLPVALLTQHQEAQNRQGRFNLSVGQEKWINVVSLNENVDGSHIIIHCEQNYYQHRQLNPNLEYYLTITAYGGDGRVIEHRYRAYVDIGELIFEDAD